MDNPSHQLLPEDGNVRRLRKPHEMTVLIPGKQRVTLIGRKVYNSLLHHAQGEIERNGVPSATYLFSAPLKSLLRATGSSGEERTVAIRYLREMKDQRVDWIPATAMGGVQDGVQDHTYHLLSEVMVEIRNGENWVSWSFPPTIFRYLANPDRWAALNLETLAKLGTYTSLALYEICARYRDNPGGLTARQSTDWWINALSQSAAGSERREWRKIKSEKIRQAITEINTQTELQIELIEHKLGRTVSEVQFSVRNKRTARAVPAKDPVDATIVQMGSDLGIEEGKLDQLIIEFGESAVYRGLEQLQKRAKSDQHETVRNTFVYLRTMLRNARDMEMPLFDPPTEPEPAPKPVVLPPPAPSAVGGLLASMRAEISSLPQEAKAALLARAEVKLKEKGLLTAVMLRRIRQGDVAHGPVGDLVTRLYAEETYGAQWEDKAVDASQ